MKRTIAATVAMLVCVFAWMAAPRLDDALPVASLRPLAIELRAASSAGCSPKISPVSMETPAQNANTKYIVPMSL